MLSSAPRREPEVLEDVLRRAVAETPAPGPTASRADKKNYTERLSHLVTAGIAAKLREAGLTGVRAPTGRDKRFMGGYGTKGVDAYLADDRHGLLLSSGTKGILFDVPKNLKNRYRDIVIEALELHKRFPYAVCGHLLFLCEEEVARPSRRFGTVLGEAVALLETIACRRLPDDAPELYEVVGIALIQPGNPERVSCAPAGVPQPLHAKHYVSALVEAFWRRNPFYVPP